MSVSFYKLILSFFTAALATFLLTPAVMLFSRKIGAMDIPDEKRRIHTSPVPRLGGIAVFGGILLSSLIFITPTHIFLGIFIGAIIILLIGVADDLHPLPWWIKLLAQLLAAGIAIAFGIHINVLSNPNVFSSVSHFSLGWLSVPITLLWFIGITNSVNLIDGLDGLATGVSSISSFTMLIVSFLIPESGNEVTIFLTVLLGSCLGFLPFNFNPAKIFLGDSGSLLLGYLLAAISAVGMFKYHTLVSFITPLFALAFPISDLVFSILRRLRNHQSLVLPDRGHIHHRMLDLGLTQKQAVTFLYAVSSLLGCIATVFTRSGIIRLIFSILSVILAIFISIKISKTKSK